MKEIARKYKLHLVLWLLFILYESVVIGLITGVFGKPLTYVIHYTLIILLFYIHAGCSLPWALKNYLTAFWRLPLLITLEISAFILISYFVDKLLINSHVVITKQLTLTYQNSLTYLYRGIYFMGFSTGYYFILKYIREKKRANELEKERLENIIYIQKYEQELTNAQNAFLKAQINPHLLFNTLDFIYHNVSTSSPIAADAVITLSEMMRYAIDSDKMGDFICLGDEIDQVENLMHLSQIRKQHELKIKLNYQEEVRRILFIPLVLLTLVENMFKHGDLSQPESEASVSIYIKHGNFNIETNNLTNYYPSSGRGHTGLQNIKKRLKFAYGDNLSFSFFTDGANHFKVHLAIPLEQLKGHDGNSAIVISNDRGWPHVIVD